MDVLTLDQVVELWHRLRHGGDIEADVPRLRESFGADPRVRSMAVEVLFERALRAGDWEGAQALLLHADVAVRQDVGKALKAMLDLRGDDGLRPVLPPLFPALVRALADDSNRGVCHDACARVLVKLCEYGVDTRAATETLRRRLTGSGKVTRRNAALALSLMGAGDDVAGELGTREDPSLRAAAATSLGEGPPPSREERAGRIARLSSFLADPHRAVRAAAVHALGRLLELTAAAREKRAVAASVAAALQGRSDLGKASAELAEECGRIASLLAPDELPEVLEALRSTRGEERKELLRRLAYSAGHGLDVGPALAQLTAALADPDVDVRLVATQALVADGVCRGRWGQVLPLLEHDDAEIRSSCAGLIGTWGLSHEVGVAVPALNRLSALHDVSGERARTALQLLMMLGTGDVAGAEERFVDDLADADPERRARAEATLKAAAVMGRDVATGLARVTERAHSDALAQEWGFPQFDRPVPIDVTRSWIARLAAIGRQGDPEVSFYVVTLLRDGREVGRVFAEVHEAGEERTVALERELDRVARAGKANTDYRGSVVDSCNGWFQDTVDRVSGW